MSFIAMCIFIVGLFCSGVGQIAVSTLGIPYIDDNVESRESPVYLAITIGVRTLGPTIGFLVGLACSRFHVDLKDPGYDRNDPRWIMAWWLGPVIIGTLMLLASVIMFSFPKELRGNRSNNKMKVAMRDLDDKPKLKDFPKTLKRQLSNDILMFRTASAVFHLLPIAGFYTFLPKYLQSQFGLDVSETILITAFGGICVMGIGILISAVAFLKIKPSAKKVAGWIALTALIYSIGMVILMFVGCTSENYAGLSLTRSDKTSPMFQQTCKLSCECDLDKFAPICGSDGKTYSSSCIAGCTTVKEDVTNKNATFMNCACINETKKGKNPMEAVSGGCDKTCKNFILFVCIFAISVFVHSTSEVGGMMVIMRCTHPKDKAMALGVIQSAIGLFGNVPCPIIYGAVVDSACLIWQKICDENGACLIYDGDLFRNYFLGVTAAFMFLAFLMDLIVWYKANRIDIIPEEANKSPTKTEPEKKSETNTSITAGPDISV